MRPLKLPRAPWTRLMANMDWSRRLLAVEVAGDKIRAAVVRKSGKRIDIVDFAAMTRPDPEDDLPAVAVVKALAERLQHAGGPVVFVTPMARTFDLIMDRQKVAAMKTHQLKEAVKWEVEPYTGITGHNALIGVEPALQPILDPGDAVPEDDEAPVTVSVSAMERNVHRALKARFKAAGFNLLRVYPPDVTFFMPLLLQPGEAPRAILEVGEDYSNFAILHGRVPLQISTLSLSLESITTHLDGEVVSPELEESLRFTARQVPSPEPLVISGAGAAHHEVVAFIAGFCPNGARPLLLSRAAGITDAKDDPAHAVYAGAVGAAVRELLGGRERVMGIDDRIDPILRMKKSAYLAPLATAVILALLLLGHYGFMKHKEGVYKERIQALGAELKSRKADIAAYEGLLRENQQLQERISFARRRLKFISGRGDAELDHAIQCLTGIAESVCDRIVLSEVRQVGADAYSVAGRALNLAAISRLTANLQKKSWCESAVLVKVEGEAAALKFELTVTGRREAP